MHYLTCSWALLYGVYFYVLFQLMYLVRFGTVNTYFSVLDIALYVVGVVSAALVLYFVKKLPRKKWLMAIPFVVALPLAAIGALGGGLLGFVGVLAFGILPFVVVLPLGYWIIRRAIKSTVATPTETPLA